MQADFSDINGIIQGAPHRVIRREQDQGHMRRRIERMMEERGAYARAFIAEGP